MGLGQGLDDELGHRAALDDGGSFPRIEVEDHLVGIGRKLLAPGRTPQRTWNSMVPRLAAQIRVGRSGTVA